MNSVASEILVEIKTPLRFKINGRYVKDFALKDFWNCLYRRTKTMLLMYGCFEDNSCNKVDFPSLSATETFIEKSSLTWHEEKHYSARQKFAMDLGGVVGSLKLKGNFSNLELKLLEFAKIANAGKNTNFGLGQIDYWCRW